MTFSVFIDGGAGTTGLEIADRLAGRSDISLIRINDADRKDAHRRAEAMNAADFVILCLPDDAAREAVTLINNPATRVIDASSAHRTAPGWIFGFSELSPDQRAAITTTRRLSNPGCYSTGFIALAAPLVAAGLIDPDARLTCNAVSGYSGGGKALIERFQSETHLAFRTYALSLAHKHVPEMQMWSGLTSAPLFAPSVVPAYRGMLVEIPLHAAPGSAAAMQACLTDHYAPSALVRVHDAADTAAAGELLMLDNCPATDRLDLYVLGNADGSQVRLIARLDNLGKGAGGACVQNLNLMAGLPETEGLRLA